MAFMNNMFKSPNEIKKTMNKINKHETTVEKALFDGNISRRRANKVLPSSNQLE